MYKKQTSQSNIVNKGQFKTKNDNVLEQFTIKKGTVWNVWILNNENWFGLPEDQEEKEFATEYTFKNDVTITLNQVYPLDWTPMFLQAGETNIVCLSADPTEQMTEMDSAITFVQVNEENDWDEATHVILK